MCVFGLLRFLVPDFHVFIIFYFPVFILLFMLQFGCVCMCVVYYFLFFYRFTWTQGGIHFVYYVFIGVLLYQLYENGFFSFKMKEKSFDLQFCKLLILITFFLYFTYSGEKFWILSIWKLEVKFIIFELTLTLFQRQIKYKNEETIFTYILFLFRWWKCMKPPEWEMNWFKMK